MTDILLNREQVLGILRSTGAFREGHFALPSGAHANHYIQMPLALRFYRRAKVLSVGLSRLFRGCREVVTALPHIAVIAPPSGGIPVAYGVGEAIQAEEILWAERENHDEYRFRQYMEVRKGDKCILVDDILRSGKTLKAMIELIHGSGGEIIAIGTLVAQRIGEVCFDDIPFYSLVDIQTERYQPDDCPLCQAGVPLDKIRE
jgi:orotate phosphoribosyltransferase